MARPTSFRLPEALLGRIDEAAAERGTSATALVASLLDEGLKTQRFPGIVYRDGPAGRRVGVVGGPDVWEIVRALRKGRGAGDQRIQHLARELALDPASIRLAADYYAAFPDEIDARLALEERASDRIRELIRRRESLLAE